MTQMIRYSIYHAIIDRAVRFGREKLGIEAGKPD
jgi:hypothetical protein